MAIVDRVSDVVEGLRQHAWPFLGELADPLNPTELLATARQYPLLDQSWIDEGVIAWWSWHNGLSGHRLDGPRGYITPDGLLRVAPFAALCHDYFVGRVELANEVPEAPFAALLVEWPTIPISYINGENLCIRKAGSGAPWTMWQLTNEWEWLPLADAGDTIPLAVEFERYLEAFAERMNAGLLSPGPRGNMARAVYGGGGDDQWWEYPWQ